VSKEEQVRKAIEADGNSRGLSTMSKQHFDVMFEWGHLNALHSWKKGASPL
jgi:hypothetical protein